MGNTENQEADKRYDKRNIAFTHSFERLYAMGMIVMKPSLNTTSTRDVNMGILTRAGEGRIHYAYNVNAHVFTHEVK